MPTSEISNARAQSIYQDLLDRIADAYADRDFDAYRRMIHVPHTLSSYGPVVRLDTEDDLRRMFDGICNKLKERHIDTYMRICIVATFDGASRIVGAHETRLMDRSLVLEHAYPVKSVLRRINGNWMVCESDNAIDANTTLGRVLAKISQDRKTPPVHPTHNAGPAGPDPRPRRPLQ